MPREDQNQNRVVSITRPCRDDDRDAMLAIINPAAEAYRGVIPADRWHVPYMPSDERMLLSWDFGMADGGCDPFYARRNAREPLGQQPPGVAQIARDTPADDLPHQG
jgi:hypothetical protein